MAKLDTRRPRKSHHAMPDARATILKRLDDLGWNRWRLATECQKRGVGTAATVMKFLNEDIDTTTQKLNVMFDVLGIEYVVTGEPKEQS